MSTRRSKLRRRYGHARAGVSQTAVRRGMGGGAIVGATIGVAVAGGTGAAIGAATGGFLGGEVGEAIAKRKR